MNCRNPAVHVFERSLTPSSIRSYAALIAAERMETMMSLEHAPSRSRPVNWRVKEFCNDHGFGRTKFYELVAAGKIKVIKCGSTSLIPDAEAQRFQAALEAGEI